MSYYTALGLNKEPFSTSPDPEFFYRSAAHESALRRLEISLRLKRGLNLVLGDVGTGKTTLSRALVQSFAEDEDFEFLMVLNPRFESEFQFVSYLCRLFKAEPKNRSLQDCLEAIQQHLYRKGVEEKKTPVLLIDEGQNLTPSLIENVRTLLNYETNEFKLLQVVLIAQLEILPRIKRIRNFMDRVSLKYMLNPLDLEEMGEMIRYRLETAGAAGKTFFTDQAIESVYHETQGYPRQVNMLCHNALRSMTSKGKSIVDGDLLRDVIAEEASFS